METKKEISFQELAVKVLNIDSAKYIELARSQVLASNSRYLQVFQDLKSAAHITQTPTGTSKPQEKLEFKFTERIEELSSRAKTLISKITKSMEKGGILHKCLKLMELFGGAEYKTLESLGLVTNEQKLALILNSYRDHKNSDRREIINSGRYCNIFNPDEALKSIQDIYSAAATREALTYRTQLVAEMSTSQVKEQAIQFSTTFDLDEAAGCIYGIKQGTLEFSQFYKQLSTPSANLVCLKLKMLTCGEYLGIKLIMDNLKNSDFVRWVPNQKVFNKIWNVHADKYSKDEWIEACPQKAEKIEHKFLRKAGVFVPYTKPRSNVKDNRHWEGKIKPPKGPAIIAKNARNKRAKKSK